MNPRVSILLSVRNAERTLERCLHSIRNQTFSHWELILVDDGSTDNSLKIARGFGCSQIRILQRPPQGIPSALNAAAGEAQAPLLCRMDADDVMHLKRIERQVLCLDQNPELSLVSCRVRYAGDAHAQQGYAGYVEWTNSLLDHESLYLNRFVESPFAHPSVCLRRSAFDQWGGYKDNGEPEDYALWLEGFEQAATMLKLPETLLDWSDPPDRASRTQSRYSVDSFFRLKCRYLKRWLEATGKQAVLWGAGRVTRKRFQGIPWTAFVDVDPKRIGKCYGNADVISAEALDPAKHAVVAGVGSRGARQNILADLAERGFVHGVNCIAAA